MQAPFPGRWLHPVLAGVLAPRTGSSGIDVFARDLPGLFLTRPEDRATPLPRDVLLLCTSAGRAVAVWSGNSSPALKRLVDKVFGEGIVLDWVQDVFVRPPVPNAFKSWSQRTASTLSRSG